MRQIGRDGASSWSIKNTIVATIVALGIAAMTAMSSCETLKKGEKDQEAIARSTLNNLFKPNAMNGQSRNYFSRPDAESRMAQHLNDDPPDSIMVITGANYVGKTTVLQNVLARRVKVENGEVPRKGVVEVNLNKNDVLCIEKRIVQALGANPDKVYNFRDFITRVCSRFYEENAYYPVIVLRTTADMGGPHALTIASALSHFSRTTHSAVTIMDLLTAKTAISMLQEWRAFIVAVPELTQDQVADYLGAAKVAELQAKGVSLSQIMAAVGGSPVLLDDLAKSTDPQGHVRVLVEKAGADLQSYLQRYPGHRAALLALSARPYEQGISLQEFNAANKTTVRILDLGDMSGESLQYSLDRQTVVFTSRAHHAAAQSLFKDRR